MWYAAGALIVAVVSVVGFYCRQQIRNLEQKLNRYINWQKDHDTFPGLPMPAHNEPVLTNNKI